MELEADIKRYHVQIAAKGMEIDALTREAGELNSRMQKIGARLQGIPLRDGEYAELVRERDSAKLRFADTRTALSRMTSGALIESGQLGGTLEQLDAPSMPQKPSEPKRLIIIALGALAGLVAGLVTAGARELKDQSLKVLKDVRAYSSMPCSTA